MIPRLFRKREARRGARACSRTTTGQVGKTTLARALYGGELRYLNLDSPGERDRLRGVPAEAWGRVVGPAVLDEVQKSPGLLDKIKWSYDEGDLLEASYLRTSGGLEVDLLLEQQDGILAFELKSRPRVDARDATGLERARRILGDRYRGGLVIYRGDQVLQLTGSVFAVPDWVLLGDLTL